VHTSQPTHPDHATLPSEHSVAKQLFLGNIVEENLFPYPQIRARDKEMLGAMTDAIDQFLNDKTAALKQYDRDAEQPAEFIQALRDMGLFGLIIPEAFGGLELSNGAYARVLGQTSSHDSSVSLTIGAHSSIGMKGLLLFGSNEQKQRYLPRLATGEMIAAFCLTEAGAGSDAASIRTKAVCNDDGSWTLSGEKIWITNGGIADFYTVFARTDTAAGKITAFLVEAAWPGVSHGPHEDKMGIRASSTTTVAFADVRVPPENVLGPVGKGFKVAMSILNSGRTGLGGGAVGGMRSLIRLASAQAKERKQFGQPIADFQATQFTLADMETELEAARYLLYVAAAKVTASAPDKTRFAAMAKRLATDTGSSVVDRALQLHGGYGYLMDYPIERFWRDLRVHSILEGTNQIMRIIVSRDLLRQ